jgi:hypothetical protein
VSGPKMGRLLYVARPGGSGRSLSSIQACRLITPPVADQVGAGDERGLRRHRKRRRLCDFLRRPKHAEWGRRVQSRRAPLRGPMPPEALRCKRVERRCPQTPRESGSKLQCVQPAAPVEPSQEFTQAPFGVCKWSCGTSPTATNCVR